MTCVITGKMTVDELVKKQLDATKAIDAQAKLGHKLMVDFRKVLSDNNFIPFEIGQILAYELAHVAVDNNFDIFMIIEEVKNKYMNFLEIELRKSQMAAHPERFDKDGKRISARPYYEVSTCATEDDELRNMDIDDMAKA